MKLKHFLFITSFPLLVHTAAADMVDQSSVTTFEDGTPAVAGEVNANFQALIDAINDNASRIMALEASGGGNENNSVSGHTYQLRQIGVMNRSASNNFATTANLSQQHSITFNADGTFSLSGAESEGELGLNLGVDSEQATVLESSLTAQANGSPVSLNGTWSQNDSDINISIGTSFTVSADGNVVVSSEFSFGAEGGGVDRSESSFIVGVKTQ